MKKQTILAGILSLSLVASIFAHDLFPRTVGFFLGPNSATTQVGAYDVANSAVERNTVIATRPPSRQGGLTVIIDANTEYQTIDGFGTSERTFDDPHLSGRIDPVTGRAMVVVPAADQEQILNALYLPSQLGLTRVRPVNPDTADPDSTGVRTPIEPVNDNNDPYVTDLTKFNFEWKALDDHCHYINRARQFGRGVNTYFLSPLNRERWMSVDPANPNNAAEYAEWMLAQVQRCRQLGVDFPYLSIANEPSYFRNEISAEFVRDVIKNLGPRLRSAGFPTTKFVVNDDIRSTDSARQIRIIMADPVARSFVGALGTHLYDESEFNPTIIRQVPDLGAQYGLPVWMTEYTSGALGGDGFRWGELMHQLLTNNFSAIDYLWAYSGEGFAGQYVAIQRNGNFQYTGYAPTKPYYVTGQYSKFVRPGSKRISAVPAISSNVRTSAYKQGAQIIIVAQNINSFATVVTFNGLSGISSVQPTRTSVTENWASLPGIAVNGGEFAATLPPSSVTTFVSNTPAADATVSGRVLTPDGRSLRNIIVSLMDSAGVSRTATTSSFGFYSFDSVRTGETYTITAASRRYRFTPRILVINGSIANLDLLGLE